MEMIDVLTKLKEIAESKPELVKDAVENVEKTNPKAVTEGGMKDYLHDEAEKLSREEFLKKHGESLAGFYDAINGTEEAVEGKIPAGLKAYQDKKAGKEEKKETIKEGIQISADGEAGMMLQILKLAGMKPMGAEMPSMDPSEPQQEPHSDETDGDEMAKLRDIVTKPEDEKAEETFANEPDEKVQDTDTLVNTNSGGINKIKQQVRKEYPGDNPMAVKEQEVTEQDLAMSFRNQYDAFKAQYQEAAKKAKPDFLDMDKDGDKKEPMKKAVADKEAKK